MLLVLRDYWLQPAGALLAALIAAGVHGAIRSLLGVLVVLVPPVAKCWPSSRRRLTSPPFAAGWIAAGAAIARDSLPSSPSTPARAPILHHRQRRSRRRRRRFRDQGARRLHPRARITPARRPAGTGRGPYGCFDIERRDPQARQVWIAGGIGVTPFLAWLESLQADPARAPSAELHYCTRDRERDAFARASKRSARHCPASACTSTAPVRGDALQAAALGDAKNAEFWFCGPTGLAEALRAGLTRMGRRPRFHQEAFEMR